MRSVLLTSAGLGMLFLGTVHCSGSSPSSSPVEVGTASGTSSPAPAPATPGKPHAIGGFTAFADKVHNTLTFTRDPVVTASDTIGKDITPESFSEPPDPSGANGTPAASNVDIVTVGTCTNTFGTGNQFSCSVELISGFTVPLTNAYVQVDNETYTGCTSGCTSYDATTAAAGVCAWYAPSGTDPSCTGNTTTTPLASGNANSGGGSIEQAHGLWVYNNAKANAKALWPYLQPSGSTTGGVDTDRATVTWTFANPGNLSAYYHFTVYASEAWDNYQGFSGTGAGTDTYGSMGSKTTPAPGGKDDACAATAGATVIDAASLGGNESTLGFATSASITLPFEFTLYNTTAKKWFLCPFVGWITDKAANCPNTVKANPANEFPDSSKFGSNPIFSPFWAEMEFGTATNDKSPFDTTTAAGQICVAKVNGTSEPNRIEVIEWRNMDRSTGVGDSMDFEMFLYEGTGEIDVYYPEMFANAADTSDVPDCGNTATTSTVTAYVGSQGNDTAGYYSGSAALTGEGIACSGTAGNGGATSTLTEYQFLPQP